MNKCETFLGRVSAETCLKWINLAVNPQKAPSAGGSAPQTPLPPVAGVFAL